MVLRTMSKPGRKSEKPAVSTPRLSIRVDLGAGVRIGPGKIALLEQIASSGSISGGGRALKMSYRRAWELVEEMNRSFGVAVVETAAGGVGGGGTRLTEAGREIVSRYRRLEADTAAATREQVIGLLQICKLG
jgi:molybdate transport system regulatory protein